MQATESSIADPHAELGVPSHATEPEIRAAYRRLAARWHPDRNPHPQAAERMKRINRALHQILDREDDAPAAAPDDDTDIAEPGPRRKKGWWERDWGRPRWMPDGVEPALPIRHAARLSLEEAAFGCTHRLEGHLADLCSACAGVGRQVSLGSTCDPCGGEGRLKTEGRWRKCPGCRGDGVERRACPSCQGSGLGPRRSYHYDVRIPPGLREGQTVLLRGQGQRGAETSGDIELRIQLEPHALFTFDAEGRLGCTVPVDCYAAALSGSVQVPTLDGSTTSVSFARGRVQTLAGRGFPNRDGTRGPMVVTVQIVTPERHSAEQRALLQRLAEDLRRTGYGLSDELATWHATVQAWQDGLAATNRQGT